MPGSPLLLAIATAVLLAAPAIAAEGGEGLYGKTDDKVITNFGFGLMIFFTAAGDRPERRPVPAREAQESNRAAIGWRRMTVQADRITAAHEGWQRPGAEEQWSDSFYFGGGDGRGLAFYSRIGRRPNEGVDRGRARRLAARSRASC